MDNSSLFSMFFIIFFAVISIFCISHYPVDVDPKWVTAAATLAGAVALIYIATWCWGIDRSLKMLNRLIVDQDMLLRPELKGAMELLRNRLRELWKWGLPKN